MDSQTLTIIHYCITIFTSVVAVVLAYLKFKDDKLEKTEKKDSKLEDKLLQHIANEEQDFGKIGDRLELLNVRLSVLEDRSVHEHQILDKLDNKIDEIRDKL